MALKVACEVSDLVDHGEQVYSVFLRPLSPLPRFSAGQFLQLAVDPYEPGDFWPESRAFSIASPPTQRDVLRITYSVRGKFTARMEAQLAVGRHVWVQLPYGEFTVRPDRHVCLLGGGTGITAFAAFLQGLPAQHRFETYVLYGARRPELLIYRDLIQATSSRCPRVTARLLLEKGESAGCETGTIDLDVVWQLSHDPCGLTYYISGPPAMLKALRSCLAERGVAVENIVIDAWE